MLFAAVTAHAADDFLSGEVPGIRIDFAGTPAGDLSGSPLDYYDHGLNIAAGIPLGVMRSGNSFVNFSLSPSFGIEQAETSFLSRTFQFYDTRFSVNASMFGSNQEMYSLRIGAGCAEERETITSPHTRLSFLGMGTYHKTPRLVYFYGLSYSYILGKGLLFPVLGLTWKISPRWDMSAVLPVLFKFGYQITPAMRTTLYTSIFGNQFHFKNDNDFPGESDSLYFHTVGGRLGAGIEYRVSHWTVGADLGTNIRREIRISDSSTDLVAHQVNGGAYARVFSRWSFGGRKGADK